VIELQASGACYSWRLPSSRWFGGGLHRSTQEACAVLWRKDYAGYHAHSAGTVKSNTSRACY
jgi:hypothetical protein